MPRAKPPCSGCLPWSCSTLVPGEGANRVCVPNFISLLFSPTKLSVIDLVQMESVSSWDGQFPSSFPPPLAQSQTCLPCVCLDSSLDSHTSWVLWNSVLLGHHKCYIWMGSKDQWTPVLHVNTQLTCVLHCPVGLPSQNTSSRIASLRILTWWQPTVKPGVGAFWEGGL